jgi:hypothetical protein
VNSDVEITIVVTTTIDGEPRKHSLSISASGDLSESAFCKQLEYDTSCLLVTASVGLRDNRQ